MVAPIRQRYPQSVVLGAQGSGEVSLTARGDFLITQVRWKVADLNGTAPDDQATAECLLNGDDWQGTYSGNNDQSGTVHLMLAGDILTCEWTGGSPGHTATMTVYGWEYPPGTGTAAVGGGGAGGPPTGSNGPGNPILGGDTLIRDAIQSRNYVPGTSGWAIFASGSAEFADITIRGSFETISASGAKVFISSDLNLAFIELTPPQSTIPISINPGYIQSGSIDFGGGDYFTEISTNGPSLGASPAELSLEARYSGGIPTSGIDIQAQDYFDLFGDQIRLIGGSLLELSDNRGQYPMVDAGIVAVAVPAGSSGLVVNGTLFTKTFASLPALTLTLRDSSGTLARWTCRILGMSNTSFNFVIEKGATADANTAALVNASVHWNAVEII